MTDWYDGNEVSNSKPEGSPYYWMDGPWFEHIWSPTCVECNLEMAGLNVRDTFDLIYLLKRMARIFKSVDCTGGIELVCVIVI